MNSPSKARDIRLIPIDRIEVLNPRDRNQELFSEISENIKAIGLKKPITVTPRPSADGAERYLLVCGEGRLNTFKQHGELRIPALVISVTDDEAFVMSLAENIARRRTKPMERMAGITLLRQKGYSNKEISEKTGLVGAVFAGNFSIARQR
jgi:ParB family chromosome partitioning protein